MARAADPALAEWWRELIELAEESSFTVAEFCRQHDVSTASFYNWRRKFRDLEREPGGFVSVTVTAAEHPVDAPQVVRIVLSQGIVMEVPAGDRELVLLLAGTLARAEEQA